MSPKIRFEEHVSSPNPSATEVLELFERAGIAKPAWTTERMERALNGSSRILSAWDGTRLVGFLSALSDFAWIAYISQLAVDPEWQKQGIGRSLVERLQRSLGDEITLVVHSADTAGSFYQSIGFASYANVFVKKRLR